MEEAKSRLEDEFEVIGGIISPVNDLYGKIRKASLQAANGQHRVAMVKAATASSDWIGVSEFEVSLDGWTKVAVVMKAYSTALNHHFCGGSNSSNEERRVHLKFVGGSDLLQSMKIPNLWRMDHQELILGQYGVVVIERESDPLTEEFYSGHPMFKKHRANIHAMQLCVENTVSSTKVRELLKRNESVQYLIPDAVIEYISKHGLYG